jgi:hypothetical protein
MTANAGGVSSIYSPFLWLAIGNSLYIKRLYRTGNTSTIRPRSVAVTMLNVSWRGDFCLENMYRAYGSPVYGYRFGNGLKSVVTR